MSPTEKLHLITHAKGKIHFAIPPEAEYGRRFDATLQQPVALKMWHDMHPLRHERVLVKVVGA